MHFCWKHLNKFELHKCTGYGSVLNYAGDVEMEASIMDGRDLNAGCCTLVQDIHHPISLAKDVMLKTNHTFLGGVNVMKFAREHGYEILPPGALVTKYAIEALEEYKKQHALGADVTNAPTEIGNRNDEVGTVGAIAIDRFVFDKTKSTSSLRANF